jgi:Family of unknown function (DUF6152)
MKNRLIAVFAVAVGLLVVSVPLSAHHGNAAYDNTKYVNVKGTVTQWIWTNPHCFLKLDVKDDKGKVVHWTAETAPPASMRDRGWTNNTFKPGDQVNLWMLVAMNGQPVGRIRQIVLPDGKTLTNEGGLVPLTLENSKNSDKQY